MASPFEEEAGCKLINESDAPECTLRNPGFRI